MDMITEDYVPFDVAKLLKEKGFNWIVTRSFFEHDNCYAPCDPSEVPRKDAIAIPTLQMAMKWLREVYKLYISVIPNPLNYKHQDIQDEWACEVTRLSDLSYDSDYEFFQKKYQTYESACEAAIRYCLQNLI